MIFCVQVNFCESSPCLNGGVCTALEGGHSCMCPEGFSGRNCEFFGFNCASNPCQNNGVCRTLENVGYTCECLPGSGGTHCELDTANECASQPCQREGICQDRVGDYSCYCPPKWRGKNCNTYDRTFRGGLGRDSNVNQMVIPLISYFSIFASSNSWIWIIVSLLYHRLLPES